MIGSGVYEEIHIANRSFVGTPSKLMWKNTAKVQKQLFLIPIDILIISFGWSTILREGSVGGSGRGFCSLH